MTNPLPPEAAVYAACKQHLQAVCVIGHRQPFAFMVVELLPLAELVAARKAVAAAVVMANLEAATYSRIAAEHVLWAATPLPTSVKGNVLRAQVEEQYAEDMSAIVGMSAPAPFKKVSASVSLETVLALAARTAGGAVDADAPLLEAGLDSLGAVELRNQLQQALGEGAPALPSTLVFDHPTARQLAAFLEAQHAPAAPAPPLATAAGALLSAEGALQLQAELEAVRHEMAALRQNAAVATALLQQWGAAVAAATRIQAAARARAHRRAARLREAEEHARRALVGTEALALVRAFSEQQRARLQVWPPAL